jgi:adenosylcobinamide-phosphate synthase
MNNSCIIIPLVLGFTLDLVLGDPLWLPHPIRMFGKIISFFEKRFNAGQNRVLKGLLVALFLIVCTWLVLFLLFRFLVFYPYLFYPVATLMVFYGLANNSLIAEALKVNRKLRLEGLESARKQLSFIVGRDTSVLSENQIRIAILETLAENLSDGVIAPLFYYAIGGVPLMFTYKMINTLDSMIGYKNERFKDFGMFAARTDDVANYIPSRITALLMVLVSFSRRGLKFIFQYGNKHSSPNAGYPEAALAGILNCRFGGPNVYHGKIIEKPFIGFNNRFITNSCITKACVVNLVVSLISVILIAILT